MLPIDIADALTEAERLQVETLLQSKVKYIDHPSFHPPVSAEKKLFSTLPAIARADVDWYLSYMNVRDNLGIWNKETSRNKQAMLTREEEASLFLKFNFAKFKLSQIIAGIHRNGMTLFILQEMLRWHRIVLSVRMQIAEFNLGIVLSVARNYRGVMDPDIVSDGNERLLNAIEHFDISTGNKFSTYAWYAVANSIFKNLKERRQDKEICEYRDEFLYGVQSSQDPEREVNIEAIRHMFDKNLAHLTKREQATIRYRFFERHPDGRRYVFEEIGAILGVSRTCIQLTERDALIKLKIAWKKYIF